MLAMMVARSVLTGGVSSSLGSVLGHASKLLYDF